MSNPNVAAVDDNGRVALKALSSTGDGTIVDLWGDPILHALLTVGAAGSGITSINADTTTAQIIALGTTGTSPNIVDNGTGTHTIELPVASATNTGVLSNTDWSTFNGKGAGTVTSVSVTTANGVSGTVATATTTPAITLTLGAITPSSINVSGLTISSAVATDASKNLVSVANTGTGNNVLASSPTLTTPTISGHFTAEGVTTTGATGTGNLVFATSPTLTTPTIGSATASSINGLVITASAAGTLTVAGSKTLTANNSLTLAGTDSTTMTFPSTTATIARTDAAQTFTGTQTFSQVITTANTVTVTTNAGTVPITSRINNFTNSSASAMTITMAVTSAVDGQMSMVRIYDFSGVAEGITWVNTENSTVTVPTTSNGSTTLPITVGFQYNGATSKWRCIASA